MKSKCKICIYAFFIFWLINFNSFVFADEVSPSIEQRLDALLVELKSDSLVESDPTTYSSLIAEVLKKIRTEPNSKEVFRSHPINHFIQERLVQLALGSYKSGSKTLTKNLEDLIAIFTEFYPPASSFLAKLRKIKTKSEIALDCELASSTPDCIAGIALSSNRTEEDVARFRGLLSAKLKDLKLDKLSYLILSVIEKDHFKLEGPNSCDDLARIGEFRPLMLESNIDVIGKRFGYLKSSLNQGSTCMELIRAAFPEVANHVCREAYFESCLTAFSIYTLVGMDQEEKDILTKNFILAKHTPQSKSIAKGMLSRKVFSKMNLNERLKLFFGGMLPKVVYLMAILIFVAPVIAMIGYFFVPVAFNSFLTLLVRIFPKAEQYYKIEKSKQLNKQEEERRMRDRLDEFSLLLEVFGLTEDASVDEIKRAYRELVKKLHPDAADETMQAEFERVQAAYDRLLELKSGWFGLSRK